MKKLIILSTVLVTFLSCSVNKKPEFLRVENIKVLESTSEYITLTADALFMNPNDIGGELKTDEIKVLVNGNHVASVATENFKVPAKKEFSIPLKTNIPTDSILSNNNLSGLLGSLLSKKIKVQYKGDIKYKVLGFSHSYVIDKTEDVKLKF
ncbi:LEA type 2 family protein [uncultured Psychroserpens sp.]|uniref:LEA type 2 family protein n=1 Tax=uncultured Psychroserpens sp. TaxID=255436 RepID=UPI00261347D3|nr:LEA type 2 family protein [uncultured Psychroserpens sp.]